MAKNQRIKIHIRTFIKKINALLPFFLTFFIYLLTTFPTVQNEDSGELITSALALDIAHPPGYPLYILVGKLFSILIPFGNPAWRINIMSAFFGALTAQILYVIIKKKTYNELIAFGSALLYAFSGIIWGQSNRAEVYTLSTFFLVLIIYLLMRWHDSNPKTKSNKWLYLGALAFGLAVGNHHVILLAAPALGIYVLIKNLRALINPKIILSCLGLLAVGLSVYAYLPIRTYIGPYDNPAYIEHTELYSWDKFINFVNRKIYGGTVNTDSEQAASQQTMQTLPGWVIEIKNLAAHYGSRFIDGNATGLLPLLKLLSNNFYYIPLFFFLPGLYYLFKKDPQWATLILMLFGCYTIILNIFTPIQSDINDVVTFSTQPFIMPAVLILTIITGHGLAWAHDSISNKKIALAFSILCIFPTGLALANNFTPNNESQNYLAYDFNKLALESLHPNAYFISTGKDNMTFPLYYLRKIENIRPDVTLEIYYGANAIDENFLRDRLIQNNGKAIFTDLLPTNYANMKIKPYNFVYQYGEDSALPEAIMEHPSIRGIKKNMDFPDTRLKMFFYIKSGIMAKDPALKTQAFNKVLDDPTAGSYYVNIIGDYAYINHDYQTAKKAYTKSNNGYGLQKTNDAINNPLHMEDELSQTGMN